MIFSDVFLMEKEQKFEKWAGEAGAAHSFIQLNFSVCWLINEPTYTHIYTIHIQ